MKKFASLILALIMVMTLAACAKDVKEDETTTEPETTAEATTEGVSKNADATAVDIISAYSNEELGIDADRDDENFKFAVKEATLNGKKCYRVDAVYMQEQKDGTVSFDTKGIFYVSDDLTTAYSQNLETGDVTELPAK